MALYSRFDVIVSFTDKCGFSLSDCGVHTAPFSFHGQNLAAQRTYNHLDMTMLEAIRTRTGFVEGVIKCYPDETLDAVIERIVKAEVHAFRFRISLCYFLRATMRTTTLVMTLLLPGPSPGAGGQG